MSNNICIFGASITWGSRDYDRGGWAGRLRSYIENKNHRILTYNLGVSGNTTTDLLKRFKNECVARNPRTIIISVGSNDAVCYKTKDNTHTTLKQFRKNYIKLIKQAKKFTNEVVIVGLNNVDESKTTPIPWNKDRFCYSDVTAKYNLVIKELSDEFDILFVDVFDLLTPDELDDGRHPTSIGHEKMFLKIKDFLLSNKILEF